MSQTHITMKHTLIVKRDNTKFNLGAAQFEWPLTYLTHCP
jgi:hypothetical protein